MIVSGLLVGSTVTWRTSTYYSGGIDPVVAAKGLMNVVAMVLAIIAARRAPARHALNSRTSVLLGLLLIVGLFGAWYSGSLASSAVLSARVVVLAVTVNQVLRVYDIERVFRAVAIWIVGIVLVAVGTGLRTTSATHLAGRLQGGLPPLQPNEISELCGIIVLGLAWRLMQQRGRSLDVGLLVTLTAFIWLTGSRTGLLAVIVALVVMLVQVRRLPIGLVVLLVLAIPGVFYVGFGTSLVSGFLDRGGSSNVGTLSDRTIAWSSALHLHTGFWDTWFGSGLSLVQVPVSAQYRTVQLLDSSWLSALVQSGVIGLALFGVWMLVGVDSAVRAPRSTRPLMTALMAFVLFRSFLESGLVGATPAYVVFLIVAFNPRPLRERIPTIDFTTIGSTDRHQNIT